jgi:Zn-dependent protease
LPIGVQITVAFAVVNLFLGLFNLLRSRLDGAAILGEAPPRRSGAALVRYALFGVLVLFALVL